MSTLKTRQDKTRHIKTCVTMLESTAARYGLPKLIFRLIESRESHNPVEKDEKRRPARRSRPEGAAQLAFPPCATPFRPPGLPKLNFRLIESRRSVIIKTASSKNGSAKKWRRTPRPRSELPFLKKGHSGESKKLLRSAVLKTRWGGQPTRPNKLCRVRGGAREISQSEVDHNR